MRYIVILLSSVVGLAVAVPGCSSSGREFSWPWSRSEGVPITEPTSEDPNVVFPERPAAPPTPAEWRPRRPRRSPCPRPPRQRFPRPCRRPAPAPVAPDNQVVEGPTDLTALLRQPAGARPGLREAKPIITEIPGAKRTSAKPAPGSISAAPAPAPTVTSTAKSPMMNPDASRGESSGSTAAVSSGTPAPAPAPVAAAATPTSDAAAGPDEVVAASVVQVNRNFLTVDDILRPLARKLAELPNTLTEDTFRQYAAGLIAQEITRQVTRRLVVEEAEKRLVDDQKKLIDHEVTQVKTDMLAAAGGSITVLRQKLAKEGLTLEQALDDYRREATFKLYLRHRFIPAIPVTRKMLWDYYCTHGDEFSTGRKVQMQIIAEPFSAFLAEAGGRPSATETAAAKKQAQLTIEAAKARLDAGDDFGEVAKKYSRGVKASSGGTWPMMESGSFKEAEVEKIAFALPAGEVSKPIETPHGWFIVKAVQVVPGQVVRFEDAQEQIAETLRNQMYNELTDKYFQELLDKSHIVRSPKFNELALDRAVKRYWGK